MTPIPLERFKGVGMCVSEWMNVKILKTIYISGSFHVLTLHTQLV